MSMLYIHVPFCKSRCIYCDFFSSTKLSLRKEYVEALIKQIDSLETSFNTIYLGGGTPSMLETIDLQKLLLRLNNIRKAESQTSEFTIECNPDDVTEELSQILATSGVNRVSLGVQSFSDKRLHQINRRHSSAKAIEAVHTLRRAGILNISIDLMYGFPAQTKEEWLYDIHQTMNLKPNHISAYCLSVEEGTVLYKKLAEGQLPPLPSEEIQEDFYYTLINILRANGYEHYEISNFCLPNYHSRHNSGYWQDKSYTALGAGAHGYNRQKKQRYWNIRDIALYIKNVNKGISVIEDFEHIDTTMHYNDLITTAMRTAKGLNAEYIRNNCSPQLADFFLRTARKLSSQSLVNITGQTVSLAPSKLFISDTILSEFIFDE